MQKVTHMQGTAFEVYEADIPSSIQNGIVPIDDIPKITWKKIKVRFPTPGDTIVGRVVHEAGGGIKGDLFFTLQDLKTFLRQSYQAHKKTMRRRDKELEDFKVRLDNEIEGA